jgi:hypothetical protein
MVTADPNICKEFDSGKTVAKERETHQESFGASKSTTAIGTANSNVLELNGLTN